MRAERKLHHAFLSHSPVNSETNFLLEKALSVNTAKFKGQNRVCDNK